MVFQRVMNFIKRLELVLELFRTCLEYIKLEKVVCAGLKGRDLTIKVRHIEEVLYIYLTKNGSEL